ncbi:MAG: hypothetical protein ACREPQ_09620 [Rhodanobacter sp.]
MLSFHTGTLWGKGSAANATPQSFGTLQNVSVDIAITTKELFGQLDYPVAVGQGSKKITGKASSANIQARLFNDIFFGGTLAAGETVGQTLEPGAIPMSTAYTVTVVNSATWIEDLEVKYASTGLPFVKVASAPTVGQYMVAAGVYTFAVADAGVGVLISYSYTKSTAGQTLVASAQTVGAAPTFTLSLALGYNGATGYLKLFACTASKLTLATKLNDFVMPNFEFQAFANPAGQVLALSTSDGAG